MAAGVFGIERHRRLSRSSHGRFFADRHSGFGEESASIGQIHGVTNGDGNGIIGLQVRSSGGIAGILGETISDRGASGLANSNVFASGSNIGEIIGGTQGTGSGITGLTAGAANGRIAAIIGSAFVEFGQHGIENTSADAFQISVIQGTGGGAQGADGIKGSNFGGAFLPSISGESHSDGTGHGIEATSFNANTIGPVTAKPFSNNGEAITTSQFNAPNVGLVTATNYNGNSHTITASTLGTARRVLQLRRPEQQRQRRSRLQHRRRPGHPWQHRYRRQPRLCGRWAAWKTSATSS